MKISCQSCQAKYTIADEKVLGKIVKIRCKKCGATIVINGNESEAATQAVGISQGGAFDYASQGGAADSWTVNVADGDQRTMSTAEIVAAFRTGVVNDETFCWKDGMSDWLPLREIQAIALAIAERPILTDELHKAEISPSQVHSSAPPPAGASQPGFSSLFGGGGGGAAPSANGGAALFSGGGAVVPPATGSAPSARRAGGRGGGGADLFGAAAIAGGEDDVMTSASADPQMVPGGDKRTGERNENSVLFSLNALTQNAPKEELPQAQGDGSGLIDIRALSTAMKSDAPRSNKVDDIMNLSGGGAFSAALAAPVLAPPPADMPEMGGDSQKKSNTGLIIAVVGGFLMLAIIVVTALIVLKKPDTIVAAPGVTPSASTAVAAPTDTSTTPTTATADTTSTAAAPGTSTAKAPTVGGNTGAAPASRPASNNNGNTNTAPAVVTPPPANTGSCDLACQMAKSAGATAPAQTAAPAAGGGAAFDRGAAASALGAISGNLSSCKKSDGPTGSGHAKVTFNPNGTVASVEIDAAPFAGTSVGGCVAAKFRGAKIPAFSGAPVPVGKSFVVN